MIPLGVTTDVCFNDILQLKKKKIHKKISQKSQHNIDKYFYKKLYCSNFCLKDKA